MITAEWIFIKFVLDNKYAIWGYLKLVPFNLIQFLIVSANVTDITYCEVARLLNADVCQPVILIVISKFLGPKWDELPSLLIYS